MSTEIVNNLEKQDVACLTTDSLQLIFKLLSHEDFDVLTHGWKRGFTTEGGTLEYWTIYLRDNWQSGPRRTLLQACSAAREELAKRGKPL